MIEVLTTGLPNTVQDLGRPGLLGMGVSVGGAMDRVALAAGNALLGNPHGAAGIEVAYFPFRVRFHAATSFAVTGADAGAVLDGVPLPPFWARGAEAGQVLSLSRPLAGTRAYLTLAGGVDVPPVLGSRATDGKTGFGGLGGRGLQRGDRLGLLPATAAPIRGAGFGAAPPWPLPRSLPLPDEPVILRVLPAAEFEAFDAGSLERFRTEGWALTPDANRMGFRLQGPALLRSDPVELLSHGIVPGTVQVPPSGQPIIQMADANTCGGYPKIATVIEADHPLLAQAPTGARLQFVRVDWAEAREALQAGADWLADLDAVTALLRKAGSPQGFQPYRRE